MRFEDNVKWKDSVDYLFVRNFNTNPEKLRLGAEPAQGYAAYACQCKWVSINEDIVNLEERYPDLKWHCRGHD